MNYSFSLVKRFLLILVALLIIYIGSYAWFRSAHMERWARDDRDYIIFPQEPALYLPVSAAYVCRCAAHRHAFSHRATSTMMPREPSNESPPFRG